MKLKKFSIKNFRSIKDAEILLSPNCLVLIGKNEAGKTNVLKAIASLFEKYKVSNKDKRKRLNNEKIEESYVRAIIDLEPEDFDSIEEIFESKFKGTENIEFKSNITVRQFLEKVFYNILIQINIQDNTAPYFSFWLYTQKDIELKEQLYILDNVISKSGIAKFDLKQEVFSIIKDYYKLDPIKCHYWQYSDSYLLPNQVDIEAFTVRPSSFPSLHNIFALCGREDVKTEFTEAKSQDGDYSNLLDQVSKKVTNTFQRIWKDFKGTSIELQPNGSDILIKVVDKAKYNFEDRSDGFKKFISILLMLSTQVRSNNILDKDLILIDEPDQSLYPTSAQYLRDEFFTIAKKARVIYSTHSQYMIDPTCLERHLIVEKVDDISTLKKQSINAPFCDDELLRRSIGASIFECLKPKNIVFEGYLDKELFDFYCKTNKIEKDFVGYGSVYLSGISGVETLVQILLLANKKFLIIADSDETSKKKRSDFEKNYPALKEFWLAYGDVCLKVETVEDFLEIEHVRTQILSNGYEFDLDINKNVIANIEKAVKNDKELKQQLKKALIESVRKQDIKSEYQQFINKMKNQLDDL